MKKLGTQDLFNALRIIKAANLREPLKPLLKKVSSGANSLEDIGIETILIVIEGVAEAKAEDAFYEFLSNPLEMTKEEIQTLPLNELVESLKKIGEENNLKVFFEQLSGLITMKHST